MRLTHATGILPVLITLCVAPAAWATPDAAPAPASTATQSAMASTDSLSGHGARAAEACAYLNRPRIWRHHVRPTAICTEAQHN